MADPSEARYGIRVVAAAGHLIHGSGPPPGAWVSAYDPDAHDGLGEATWTTNTADALTFHSRQAAFAVWQQRSQVRPTRPDGKANRPLTAYTVSIETID
jgi:hypothetical protein